MPLDPDDNARLTAVIAGVSDDQWSRLRELAHELRDHPERALEDDPDAVSGWPIHGKPLQELVQLLYEAGLVTGAINWVERLDEIGEISRATISTAPAGDLVCMVTAMVRSDRFNEGALLGFIETGELPAAVLRLAAGR